MSAEKDKTRRVKPRVVNSMQAMKGKTRSVNKETGAVNPMLGEKGKLRQINVVDPMLEEKNRLKQLEDSIAKQR